MDSEQRRIEKQGRSVEHLQELYSVVVAIALSLVVARLIPAPGHDFDHRPVLLAVALLATLIPFYHGALRHLDEQYVNVTAQPARQFSVLIDFFLLFLESCAFLALALAVARPKVFLTIYLLLLVLDIAWAFATSTFLAGPGVDLHAQRAWLYVNLVTAGVAGGLLVLLWRDCISIEFLWYAVLLVALARSGVDYALTWRFYAAVDT